MNFSRITTWLLNEPKKLLAGFVLLLCFCLLVGEILFLWEENKSSPTALPAQVQKNNQANLNMNSALFISPLFGQYIPNSTIIRESSLNVELVGILYSKNKNSSQVIIRLREGEENSYNIGDVLPGGAKITQINHDGIVVLYRGALERLNLPANELEFDKPLEPLLK
jgi:general secretion pathway protein C